MRLLCFGDSNTYGYDPRSFFGDRYPAEVRWTDRLARETCWEVRNAGQNGREIPAAAPEFPPYDLLVVMLGSNDLLRHPRFTAADAADRMERFLRGLSHVLLVAPPPMKPGAWVTEERLLTESAALAGQYESLARRLGCAFANAGQWGVALTFDGVHFSEAGHRAFAEGLRRVLMDMGQADILEVTERSPVLLAQLAAVWESSVRATHYFLTEADIRSIAREVPAALASVPHLAAAMKDGVPTAFLGVGGERLDMLFLSPAQRGQGLGRRLLEWGIRQYGIREVCVNEQNPQALGFYEHLGFHPYKRTERDEQGRPFPLLYLRR